MERWRHGPEETTPRAMRADDPCHSTGDSGHAGATLAAAVAAGEKRRENAETGSLLRTRCPTHESQTRPQKYLVMSWTNSVGSCKPPTRRWPSSRRLGTKTTLARSDQSRRTW